MCVLRFEAELSLETP